MAGTPSSIAASRVQRPSPESGTSAFDRCDSSGSSASASAVRSSSHEATTLPRRQSSVIVLQVEVVLVVLGVAQRRDLGAGGLAALLADVGVLDDVEALGVGGHEAVLDAVVDHLDEVARARRAAVQVAVLGGAVA